MVIGKRLIERGGELLKVTALLAAMLGIVATAWAGADPIGVYVEPATGMEFVPVPGGCFMMGCGPWTDSCSGDELPAHRVCVPDFWMGRYEVTQGQWSRVMTDNPSASGESRDQPVDSVTWDEAAAFARSLTGRSPDGRRFALPTEEQWEYACRSGGKPEKFSGGADLNEVGWWLGNSQGRTRPVGSKRPNGLGLYDMSGNVWEWVDGRYDANAYAPDWGLNEPSLLGPDARGRRGGSWNYDYVCPRCSNRKAANGADRDPAIGLRLIMIVPTGR